MTGCEKEKPEDSTRLPEFYEGTYQYLKRLGLEEIQDPGWEGICLKEKQ